MSANLSLSNAIFYIAILEETIYEFWPEHGRKKLYGKNLDFFTHASLLYGLRNNLIHQNYSENGLSIFPKEREEVHYIIWNKGHEDEVITLEHHPDFLFQLCSKMLINVMSYFRNIGEAPWQEGHFSQLLMDDL